MSDAAQFFRAARYKPPIVLHRQLSEFTLGHYLFLSEADSPFLPGFSERAIQPLDIFLAAHICSGPVARQKRLLERKWSSYLFAFWIWRCRKLDPEAELAKFAEYIRRSFEAPKVGKGDGETSELPHVCALQTFLCDRMNQSFDVVQNIPLHAAVWLYAGWLEQNTTPDSSHDSELIFRPWRRQDEELWQAVQKMERKEANN